MYSFSCVEFFMPWFTWRLQCTWLCNYWLQSKSEHAKKIAIVVPSTRLQDPSIVEINCLQTTQWILRKAGMILLQMKDVEKTKSSSKVVFLNMAVRRQKWPSFIFRKYSLPYLCWVYSLKWSVLKSSFNPFAKQCCFWNLPVHNRHTFQKYSFVLAEDALA